MYYSLLITRSIDNTYQYESDLELLVGQVVVVNFNQQWILAVVMSKDTERKFGGLLKKIDRAHNYFITEQQIKFLSFFAQYNVIPAGSVLKMMINQELAKKIVKKLYKVDLKANLIENFIAPALSEEQEKIYRQIPREGFNALLLEGVTGSGKTEIYIRTIIEKIAMGEQCLLLIPEIALTDQIVARFKRYGVTPHVYTSFETAATKREVWKGVALKQIPLVIGTRSALLLPFQKLGLIVIDEEHDQSYKQEENPVYNARDMAVAYAKIWDCPIILGTATPSLESLYNALYGDYKHLLLESRYQNVKLPEVVVVPKKENELFTEQVLNEIEETVKRGEQVLVYFNRLGYNLISKCKGCGTLMECPFCSSYLVKHKMKGVYECHYCFYQIPIGYPCIKCGECDSMESFSDGIEKVMEVLTEKFPQYKVGMASSETLSTNNKLRNFLEDVVSHRVDIIVGTQIISKGHDFRDLTLGCILDLDGIVKSPDMRSLERAYQFFNQVRGRAGRYGMTSKFLVQSSLKDFDINLLIDRDKFYKEELNNRRRYKLAPFKRMTGLIVYGKNQKSIINSAARLVSELSYINNLQVFGPIPAPIQKISGMYRWRILLRYNRDFAIQNVLSSIKTKQNMKIKIDIDPISFY